MSNNDKKISMKLRNNILVVSVTGGLFVVLLAFVLAIQWPSLLQKFPARQVSQEINTSGWKKYQDPAGRYTLFYPNAFFDLEPFGYHTTADSHSFGPSATPMQNEPYFEFTAQEVLLDIKILAASSPLTDITYLKRRHNWYEQGIIKDKNANEYTYVAYGDINVDSENTYSLIAVRNISDNKVFIVNLNSATKVSIIKYRRIFEKIVSSLQTSL